MFHVQQKKPKRRSGATIHSIEEEEEDEDEDDEVEDEDEEVSHRSDADVALHVQRQVVGTREGALAQLALERPVAGVFAVVARQLVRTGKLPAAVLPRALVRLLPCNRATTTKKTTFLARFLGKNGKFGNLAATLPPYHTATILIRIVFIDKKKFSIPQQLNRRFFARKTTVLARFMEKIGNLATSKPRCRHTTP